MSAIDDLLSRAPQSDSQEVIVVIQTHDVFHFSLPLDYGDYRQTQAEAKRSARHWLAGRVAPEWAEYMVHDEDTLIHVFMLAHYSRKVRLFEGIKGEGEAQESVYKDHGPFTQLDFLKLAKKYAGGFAALVEGYQGRIGAAALAGVVERINEAKKD